MIVNWEISINSALIISSGLIFNLTTCFSTISYMLWHFFFFHISRQLVSHIGCSRVLISSSSHMLCDIYNLSCHWSIVFNLSNGLTTFCLLKYNSLCAPILCCEPIFIDMITVLFGCEQVDFSFLIYCHYCLYFVWAIICHCRFYMCFRLYCCCKERVHLNNPCPSTFTLLVIFSQLELYNWIFALVCWS